MVRPNEHCSSVPVESFLLYFWVTLLFSRVLSLHGRKGGVYVNIHEPVAGGNPGIISWELRLCVAECTCSAGHHVAVASSSVSVGEGPQRSADNRRWSDRLIWLLHLISFSSRSLLVYVTHTGQVSTVVYHFPFTSQQYKKLRTRQLTTRPTYVCLFLCMAQNTTDSACLSGLPWPADSLIVAK